MSLTSVTGLNAKAKVFVPLCQKDASYDSKWCSKATTCDTTLKSDSSFYTPKIVHSLLEPVKCHGANCRETEFLMPVYGGNFCQYHQKKIYQCRQAIIHQPKTLAQYQQSYIARLHEQQLRRIWDPKHMEAVILLEEFLRFMKSGC